MNINRTIVLICLIFVPFVFGIYSILLGQDTNWDLLNYHLYNPFAFLNNRINFDLAPAGLQTYFNPFLDVAYFFAVNHLHPKTVGFMLGLIQGLNFILVYKISMHVLRDNIRGEFFSLLLALAGLFSVGFLSEVGTTLSDSVISIFSLLSLWIIISFVDDLKGDEKPPIIFPAMCAGVLIGIGCGLKLTISIYALSMCLSFLVLPVSWASRFKLSFFFGVFVLVGLLISGGFWMYKMWSFFGNPIFPQFNNIFQGELAAFVQMRDTRFLPNNIFEKIFYPAIFTLNPLRVNELGYYQISWFLAYIATFILIINRSLILFKKEANQRRWNLATGFFFAFFCISYFIWLNVFGIYRYLIPLEMLIPVLLFVTINYFLKGRYSNYCAILFIGVITAVNVRGAPDYGHSEWAENVYHIDKHVLSSDPVPAAIYLSGQPLAWIIPALNIRAPFIQLSPNIVLSDTYWQHAKSLTAGREGKSYLVLESDTFEIAENSKIGLVKLGLILDKDSCGWLVGYVGAAKHSYKYCEVKKGFHKP